MRYLSGHGFARIYTDGKNLLPFEKGVQEGFYKKIILTICVYLCPVTGFT